jgi:hypothetical protein
VRSDCSKLVVLTVHVVSHCISDGRAMHAMMMLVVLFCFAYSIGCSAHNEDPNMEDSKILFFAFCHHSVVGSGEVENKRLPLTRKGETRGLGLLAGGETLCPTVESSNCNIYCDDLIFVLVTFVHELSRSTRGALQKIIEQGRACAFACQWMSRVSQKRPNDDRYSIRGLGFIGLHGFWIGVDVLNVG